MHIGQTDTTSVKCLINSISRFILLVSCQTLKPMPLQKICNNMVGVLKRLKPVLDDVMDHQIPLDESLRKECEKLDMRVNEARDFIEKWGPKMSKIHSVLQSGTLLIKLQSTSLDICHMIVKSLQSPPSASVLANLQNYIQELQCLKKETAMVHIEEAMRNQRDNIEPSNEHLKEIIELLKLTSNEELMKESIAVEKQILNSEANKMKVDLEEIAEIVNLILNLRDYVMKTECPVIKSGVSVPSYFRCPLSLELMLDPVIVASGQTYERQSIQKWLDHGLTVCPKTRLRLTHTNLIPNYTVKAMIANWCEENNVKLSGYSEHNNSSHITSHSDYLLDQDLAHACGFRSVPSTKSILTSSPLTGNAFEKQKGDNSFRLHGEHNGCQSGPTEKCEQQSPYIDSESRSESFSSSISSTELVLAVSKEVSGITNNYQTATGEITNVNPANKQSGISHWLSGKQFQSHRSNVGGIENGSYSYNSNTNNCHSRVDSHHVFNSGSDESATSSHVDKLVEDLQSQSIEVQPIATVSKEVSGISDKHQTVKASSGEITNVYPASTGISGKQFQSPGSNVGGIANGNKNNNSNTKNNHLRVDSNPVSNSGPDELTTSSHVNKLIEDLHSQSFEVQTTAAEELRLLTKHNMENRVIVGKCGAVIPLLSLLYSDVKITQEHAVTALLNLSINEDNKTLIMEAGALEPLIHVLKTGNDGAKENSAATLFSLSVIENNKEKIGRSGAIKALVDLLASGTLRGKKDAATALFNLSIFHENKARIVQAGGVKFLARLMDPADGMVDKAVALLSNLSTIAEGRIEIVREGGIPLLVEVLETGTQRGKENAASIILQLCLHSTKFCTMVLQEGAVPPLVALSQSGTPRAKEKAQQLLSHFRNQREGATGKGKS